MNAVLQFFARIQNRLLIAMLTVTAIPLIAVMIQASRQTTDALVSQAHESLEYQAGYRALRLESLFQRGFAALAVAAMTDEFASYLEEEEPNRRDYYQLSVYRMMRHVVESPDSVLSRLSYFEKDGTPVLSYPPVGDESDAAGLMGVARIGLSRSRDFQVIFTSAPHGLVMARPSYEDKSDGLRRRAGVLIGTIGPERIRAIVAAPSGEAGGSSGVGYFLALGRGSTDPDKLLLQPVASASGVALGEGRPIGSIVGPNMATAILSEPKGLSTLETQTVAWDTVRDQSSALDLIVGVVQPQESLLRPVAEARRIFLFILAAALILSVLLCVVFARQLTKPLAELRQGARELAAGRLDRRIHVETGDEIELLAADFNSMAEALEQSQHHLEQRIREKTEELQRANRVLIQTEKLRSLGEVAAGVAHEINNPAGIVSMYAEMLLEKPDLEERDRKKLQLILENAERISGIAGGMLDFSRTHDLSAEPVSVLAPLEKALSLASIQKIASHVDIVRELPEMLPPVRGDENQLIQVFLNLVTNALQAMPSGGRLIVSARAFEDRVEVRVRDTGSGIDPENLEKLFEPFFTTKAPGEGTGLGLSISYGIIRNHGGELSVESSGEDGTTFLVCLPIHHQDASTQG
ncbi:MAG: HAMP domain-containing sensor histidine kinase [Planctomycetota bacterium]